MSNRLFTIFLANGEIIKQEYTYPVPVIKDLMNYGVHTEIGTTKIWYPPSQIIKISYPDD